MRSVKEQDHNLLLEKKFINDNQGDVSEDDLKSRSIELIFDVQHEEMNLRPIGPIKVRSEDEFHYVQHLQTAHSKMFKLLAKPEY